MRCACCGKKKRIFESFEELDKDISICVECSKKLYKYQDSVKEKKYDEAEHMLSEISNKKNSAKFQAWLDSFQKRIRASETYRNTSDKTTMQETIM